MCDTEKLYEKASLLKRFSVVRIVQAMRWNLIKKKLLLGVFNVKLI